MRELFSGVFNTQTFPVWHWSGSFYLRPIDCVNWKTENIHLFITKRTFAQFHFFCELAPYHIWICLIYILYRDQRSAVRQIWDWCGTAQTLVVNSTSTKPVWYLKLKARSQLRRPYTFQLNITSCFSTSNCTKIKKSTRFFWQTVVRSVSWRSSVGYYGNSIFTENCNTQGKGWEEELLLLWSY